MAPAISIRAPAG